MNATAQPIRPVTEIRRAEIDAATGLFRRTVQTMADDLARLSGSKQVVHLTAGHDTLRIVGMPPREPQAAERPAPAATEGPPQGEAPKLETTAARALFEKLASLGDGASFTPTTTAQLRAAEALVEGGYARREEDDAAYISLTTIGRAWAERLGL